MSKSRRVTELLLWVLRASWLVLPLALAPGLSDPLSARSAAVATVLEALAWTGWAVGLVATLVPRTVSLTIIRVLAPYPLALGVWATVAEGVEATDVLGVVAGAVVLVTALAPRVGERFADGSSYGPERRLLLRAPSALVLGPIPLAVAVVGAGVAAGPLLLAARQWVAGVVLVLVGLPAALAAGRALHGLSRRWLVFVPGGIVVHDPLTLTDPVLFPWESLVAVEPALADSDATDLTQRAPGLALELRLAEPATIGLARPGRPEGEIVETDAVLVTPSRPAEVLDEVQRRHRPG